MGMMCHPPVWGYNKEAEILIKLLTTKVRIKIIPRNTTIGERSIPPK